MQNWRDYIKNCYDRAIKDLQTWISINSIDDATTKTDGKPFGEGVYQALRFIGQRAEEENLSVDYCDGYVSEITVGQGQEIIAIYAHCDVVPVGENWKYDPFGGIIADDIMYGRGTSDDKGPAMAAFYAILALKDEIINNGKYQVRLIVGGNEEKGSECLEYYFHHLHKAYPSFGFTPDGEFPLIYGEKGITNYQSDAHIDLDPIVRIEAGIATNSVIDVAVATLKYDDNLKNFLLSKKYKYNLHERDEETILTIYGKAAHGSTPELGVNAGLLLLELLGEYYHKPLLTRLATAYSKPSGQEMGLSYTSDLLHETTYNVGIITYSAQQLQVIVNFRYPETVNPQEVVAHINGLFPMQTQLTRVSPPLLMNPESPFVTTLLKAYQEESGDYQTPIMTIGGGTYARETKNTIAFGSHFPGREDNIHDANEKIHLEDFRKSISIYARALSELMKL